MSIATLTGFIQMSEGAESLRGLSAPKCRSKPARELIERSETLSFYVDTLRKLVAAGVLDPDARTLAVAAGPQDRDALLEAGFCDLTISNLDERMDESQFAPSKWAFIDAENIEFADGTFEQVVVHMGLHHCGSPHRALLEMYRVASGAVVVFENRDSWTLKLAVALNFVPAYELDAVRGNGYRFGGLRNSAVPNYVYRWTEREVIKTIQSADPAHEIVFKFFYNVRYPIERIARIGGVKGLLLRCLRLPYLGYAKLFPRQSNEFAFCVDKKSREHKPWIVPDTGTMQPGI